MNWRQVLKHFENLPQDKLDQPAVVWIQGDIQEDPRVVEIFTLKPIDGELVDLYPDLCEDAPIAFAKD